ncbi:hypothetical protein LTS18_013533, partial [Coniosporium uncinatum]
RYHFVTTGKKHSDTILSSANESKTPDANEGQMKCRQVIRIDSNFPLKFYAVGDPLILMLDNSYLADTDSPLCRPQDKSAGNPTPHPDHFVVDIDRHPGKLISANGKECRPKRKPPVDSLDHWRAMCVQQKKDLVQEGGGMVDEELARAGIDVAILRKSQAAEKEGGVEVGGGAGGLGAIGEVKTGTGSTKAE